MRFIYLRRLHSILFLWLAVVLMPIQQCDADALFGDSGEVASDAVIAAEQFLQKLDAGRVPEAYFQDTAPQFQMTAPLQQFAMQTQAVYMQLGGFQPPLPGSRRLISATDGRNAMGNYPFDPGAQYIELVFLARYVAGGVAQRVYMENASGRWLVVGVWYEPAPY